MDHSQMQSLTQGQDSRSFSKEKPLQPLMPKNQGITGPQLIYKVDFRKRKKLVKIIKFILAAHTKVWTSIYIND